jgi:hypothetical protein
LGIKPHFSTAYHPQTDGQTEQVNQNIEQYLRLYATQRQDNWAELLPLAEFTYNNSKHSSSEVTQFYANYAYNPAMNGLAVSGIKGASEEMAAKIKEVQEELKSTLVRASERHKRYYDKATRKLPQWEVGSKVWVKHDEAISTSRPSKKLKYKWLGPYEITERISDMAYKLKLPTSMKIHPVINADRLREAKPDEIPGREHPRPEPVVTTPEAQEWEVEYIDDSRYHYSKLQYHVKWHGYPLGEDAWQPAGNLAGSPQLIEEFHDKYPDAVGPALTKPRTTS